MVDLKSIDVSDLDVYSVPYDLRRDLHVFVQYVREREVKRLVYGNDLSKGDYRRLAKLMSDPGAKEEVEERSRSSWVDYVDRKALELGFVSYDTEGVYRGRTSRKPSYPDNYVIFNAKTYWQFLESPLTKQERQLLHLWIGEEDGCQSEFFHRGFFGRLGGFDGFGCARGVVPEIDFPQARRFLLDLMRQCEVGVWYRVESMVQYLKENHPYFLISKGASYETYREDRGRYGNFREGESRWDRGEIIPQDAPDAFERVEGRYVERFLEGAPLTLGYVDLAYESEPYEGIYPPIGHLKAFRVSERLVQAVTGGIPAPKVTVQPNFEIYVESAFYPASVIAELTPFTDLVSEDILTILKLDQEEVTAATAHDEDLDVVALLKRLSEQELPRNIMRELREWTERAEKFLLYDEVALLEGDEELLDSDPYIDEVTVKRIAPDIRIVRSPAALFEHLEEEEWVPLRMEHPASTFSPMPQEAHTLFAKKTPADEPEPERKPTVRLMRSTTVTLHCPTDAFLEELYQSLLDAKCPVKVDRDELTLGFAGRYEERAADVIEALRDEYRIQIEHVE